MQYPVDKQEMQNSLEWSILTRFVPHLSEKIENLWDILKKNATFDMTPHYKDIFDKVKKAMTSSKTLALFDPEEVLVLMVDVSTKGLARMPASVICIQISVKGRE